MLPGLFCCLLESLKIVMLFGAMHILPKIYKASQKMSQSILATSRAPTEAQKVQAWIRQPDVLLLYIVARLVWNASSAFCTVSLHRLSLYVPNGSQLSAFLPPLVAAPNNVTGVGPPCENPTNCPDWRGIHNQTIQVNPPMLKLTNFTHTNVSQYL